MMFNKQLNQERTKSKLTYSAGAKTFPQKTQSFCGSCRACKRLSRPGFSSDTASSVLSHAKAMGKESCAVSFMQRNYGNRFTASVLNPVVQKKCSCGGSCSKCKGEEEAERISMSIMKMESPAISHPPYAIRHTPSAKSQPDEQAQISEIMSSKGSGHPLDDNTRSFMGERFGYDFSHVRLHNDSYAARKSNELNAEAFTIGRDVFFNAGRYNPSSTEGKKLLAHELTHVVQQTHKSGMYRSTLSNILAIPILSIQRASKCALEHIEKECSDAASKKCLSIQNTYCKNKYPKPKDMEELYKNAVKGANDKKKDIPHAADNLLHFLSGTGKEKVMPIDIFKNHDATKNQLSDVHRNKFINGAKSRLKKGELKPGNPVEMIWTDTANAFSILKKDDLGLAVGGYTLCSKVNVSVIDIGRGNFELSFDTWTVQAFDCYNWDPGKGIGLPGADDNDLCCLQNAGKGKHFRIRTDSWNNTHAPSMAKASI